MRKSDAGNVTIDAVIEREMPLRRLQGFLPAIAVVAIGLAMLVATGGTPARAQDYAAIIAQTDRTEADRQPTSGGIRWTFSHSQV